MDHSQPASMQDVAKAASVSPQTVSRVANGSNAVRPETRQRVEAAMAKLGYRPNYAARALKHGKFKDVGVVLFNMLTYGNARILGGIADAANSNGYAITMQSFGRNRERTLHAAIERMKQLPVDGVIAVMEEHVTDFSEFRPPKELPVVIISEDPANYITDTHETSEWTRFELDFNYEHYGKTIDPQKLANGGYNVSIVLSASKDGDVFQGAPGSTLLIDDLELVCKQPLR